MTTSTYKLRHKRLRELNINWSSVKQSPVNEDGDSATPPAGNRDGAYKEATYHAAAFSNTINHRGDQYVTKGYFIKRYSKTKDAKNLCYFPYGEKENTKMLREFYNFNHDADPSLCQNYKSAAETYRDNLAIRLSDHGYSCGFETSRLNLGHHNSFDNPVGPQTDRVTHAVKFDHDGGIKCIIDIGNQFLMFRIVGELEEVNDVIAKLELVPQPEYIKVASETQITVTSLVDFDQKTGFIRRVAILTKNQCNLPKKSFYPFLSEYDFVEDYIDEFFQSSSPVLILMGPPGTGKSTFIRAMLFRAKSQAMLCAKTNVMAVPSFVDYILDETQRLAILEDADALIGKRTDGNPLMSGLLNATDGVVGTGNKKIVITTNLDNEDLIDAALLREGRCFDVAKFDLLTREQASVVQNECLDVSSHKNLTTRKVWSLSQVLNPEHKGANKRRARKNIGFTAN